VCDVLYRCGSGFMLVFILGSDISLDMLKHVTERPVLGSPLYIYKYNVVYHRAGHITERATFPYYTYLLTLTRVFLTIYYGNSNLRSANYSSYRGYSIIEKN
jgi:hypothetical protein